VTEMTEGLGLRAGGSACTPKRPEQRAQAHSPTGPQPYSVTDLAETGRERHNPTNPDHGAEMSSTLNAVMEGAVAGGLATLPMSGVMLAAGKAGLMGQQPPEKITEAALDAVGVESPSEKVEKTATVAAHLGYGVAMGAAFSLLHHELRPRGSPILSGIGFGLAVWALSYKGWVPALGIMPPPEHDRPGRPESMVLAHVVYGGVLGALVGRRG